jgi:hypothetical protein
MTLQALLSEEERVNPEYRQATEEPMDVESEDEEATPRPMK